MIPLEPVMTDLSLWKLGLFVAEVALGVFLLGRLLTLIPIAKDEPNDVRSDGRRMS